MAETLSTFRFAWRGLLRTPVFTTVAVITLALGIGATTAVFTLVDRVLLRPLPYPQSDQLLSLQHLGREGQDELPVSPGLYLLYRDNARTLSSIALHTQTFHNVTGEAEAERVEGQAVTPSLFDVLRAVPALGRPLLAGDAEEGAEPVVVLSDAFWRARFGGDPSVIGRTLLMNGVSREVVGIMPEGFGFPTPNARFWIPLTVDPLNAPLAAFGASGIARMSDGVSIEAARAELQGIIGRLDVLAPEAAPAVAFLREVNLAARVESLKEAMVGEMSRALWTLLGMVAFVLLIACANVANLLLVRAEGRQRELALRLALGANRSRVTWPFLAEGLILAFLGATLGVALAVLAVRAAVALSPTDLPRMSEIGLDLRILGFAAVLSIVCAVGFSLFPIMRAGRTDLATAMNEGAARGATSGREGHHVRNGLVVAQVALALILVVSSGLMFRSFLALRAVDPGFQPESVVTVRLTVPQAEVAEPAAVAELFRQVRERLAAEPTVSAVGSISAVPLSGLISFSGHGIEDHPTQPDELPPMAFGLNVDPGYFDALRIPLVEGRYLDSRDAADGFRGVVVSRAYAERWWPGQSALGKRIDWGPGDWWEIVGVVDHVRNRGLQQDPEELVYLPTMIGTGEEPQVLRTRDVVVRVAGDPVAFLPTLRGAIRDVNPRIPLANPQTMEDVVRGAAAETSFTMAVLGAASSIALLLGLVGIYGVVSYGVLQRTREIGVRMALGATRGSVTGLVLRQGMRLAAVGVITGLLVALFASTALDALLYGVDSRDPITYGAVALSLCAAAALASWLPARRAAGLDPATALRRD